MRLFKQLYLTDRFFYNKGGIIFLFLLSFVAKWLFPVAICLLIAFYIIFWYDVYLLFRKKAHIKITRSVTSILSLNDENKAVLAFENTSTRMFKLKIIDELPYQLSKRDFKISTHLDKGKNDRVQYSIKPTIRGEYSFGDIHILLSTTIGLCAKKESHVAEKKVAVYPSVIQMRQQELIALSHISFVQGDNKSRKIGKSYEFDQIKTYVAGDDPRNINWKASSRTGEIMVNHYEDERSQHVYSLIDKSRTMKMPFDGLSLVDYAINTTLAFANIVLKKQDNAGMISFSDTMHTILKSDKGQRQLRKIMHHLYNEKYSYTEANYELLYVTIRRMIPNRSLLFLYTNFDSLYALERIIPILRMINKFHLLVVIFFEDTELEGYSKEASKNILDIYQRTIARKFLMEKGQVIRELKQHGIHAMKCNPKKLSTQAINKYLDLKASGII